MENIKAPVYTAQYLLMGLMLFEGKPLLFSGAIGIKNSPSPYSKVYLRLIGKKKTPKSI